MSPLQRKLRRALGSFKDQTSIGLAKVASTGAPDLEVALVKATSHDEAPVDEKYVQQILHLTSFSRGYVNACVAGLAKRLSKTHNWVVAIKALMLIHRLLRDGDSSFEEELLFAGRQGMRVLNLSNFRDDSHSHAWDYSAFVRTYALFLDERLDYSINRKPHQEDRYGARHHYEAERNPEQSSKITTIKEMKPHELLDKIPLMQRLLERVLACRPVGAATRNRLVQFALNPVVRESFQLYTDICDGLAIIQDAFFEMEHPDCVKAFDIYTRGAKQVDELASFYRFCKDLGVCRSSEYLVVQRITEELLQTMEDCLGDRSRHRRRSPEPRPKSPVKETEVDEDDYEVNGMKALPAPPLEQSEPTISLQKQESEVSESDLVDFGQAAVSSEEHGDRLALALFSDTGVSANKSWAPFSSGGSQVGGIESSNGEMSAGTSGWELALVASASELSKPSTNIMAGGFDHLLLDSMYEQAADRQKYAATMPSGSASSVALPGRSASSFLALPAPVAQVGGDPFAASLTFAPPSYVQMDDMRQKQKLLVQEQQTWYQYQRDGMQGYTGLMKFYNNGYNAPFQTVYPVPYYGTSYS